MRQVHVCAGSRKLSSSPRLRGPSDFDFSDPQVRAMLGKILHEAIIKRLEKSVENKDRERKGCRKEGEDSLSLPLLHQWKGFP